MGDFGYLFCESFYQLFRAAWLCRCVAGNDPHHGFSRTAGGSIYNSYLLAYIAIAPLTGYLTDRLGGRRVITFCLLILGLAVLSMGTTHTLWTACLFFGCAGLGATGLWTPVITLVQRWFAFQRRGFALGILSVGYGLGFATMGIIFPWVVEHFNWRYAWFFLGALALAMVAVNGVFLRSDPAGSGVQPWGTKKEMPSPVDSQKAFREQVQTGSFLMNSQFWLIGFSYFAIAYSLYGITTFMVDYAKYQLNLPLEQASLLATIHGLGQIVGVLTVLPLSDYLGRKKTILISNSAITACLAAILVAGGSWVLLCIFIGCLAVFFGATFPIYGACAGDYFPRQVMGTIIGAWTPFYGSGGILAHWVTGMLRDATGIYNHAFLINVLMGTAAVLLISRVRKK